MKRLGTAIILSGPSGVGKSTVCSFLFKKYTDLKFSVSCTTRAPRPGEVDGVQGMRLVRQSAQSDPRLAASFITVFLAPPSLAALEQRLRGRGTETEESIRKRLGNAAKELAAWREYDSIVVNDVAEQAADRLDAILTAAHARTATCLEEPWLA